MCEASGVYVQCEAAMSGKAHIIMRGFQGHSPPELDSPCLQALYESVRAFIAMVWRVSVCVLGVMI